MNAEQPNAEKLKSGKAEISASQHFSISAFSPELDAEAPLAIHDCWNTIGVEGNGTCRELVKFIHCRNCPVYSSAGRQLLDRPLPAEYRREQAEHYAQAKRFSQPSRLSVVLFRLGAEWLALPTSAFQEVAERRGLHTLPHRRRGLALGLVNVRGELLICASLARLLGLEQSLKSSVSSVQPARLKTENLKHQTASVVFDRLLVANWEGERLAFPVDEVHGIQRFQKMEMKEPPATISRSALTYTQGVFAWHRGPTGEVRTVGLLDLDSLFHTLNRSLQ